MKLQQVSKNELFPSAARTVNAASPKFDARAATSLEFWVDITVNTATTFELEAQGSVDGGVTFKTIKSITGLNGTTGIQLIVLERSTDGIGEEVRLNTINSGGSVTFRADLLKRT